MKRGITLLENLIMFLERLNLKILYEKGNNYCKSYNHSFRIYLYIKGSNSDRNSSAAGIDSYFQTFEGNLNKMQFVNLEIKMLAQ